MRDMTIKDIAKESGYSVSTVSRVLNNRRDVSPEAKKKINEIVAAHNFVPNNNAKHLKQAMSKTILVLVKGNSNMLFSSIVEEIQKTVEKTKYAVGIYYLDEDENEVAQAIALMQERKPIGILFLGGNPRFFEDGFGEIRIPCVLVTNQGNELNFQNLSSVATDDVKAAEAAVDFLIEKGHQKIGILGGDLTSSHTSEQRLLGCEKSFKKHGFSEKPEDYYEKARFSFEKSYQAMNRLLDRNLGVTAVFAMSDVMAIGAIRAIKDRNMSVPEDISIIGFDGITLAEYYNPKLATIKQQSEILAVRSVEILLNAIDLKKSAVHEVVPFTLIAGESVRSLI